MPLSPLPIDDYLDEILRHVRARRAVVVTAAPGAGKTTRVPPALATDGPVMLLQPRRVAARSIARRIADERGWTLGRDVGWHVRFDRNASPETRVLVATEGILTARLQQDPLLSDVRTLVIDEFHERSIHADLGLALARQAWLARDDLRLVVMSATLDAERVAGFLDGCPIVTVPGRLFPISVRYRPGVSAEEGIADSVRPSGAVLCFLPGAPEIRRTAERLAPLVREGVQVLPLHGGLTAEDQDAAVRPGDRPRVILATNLAETTLTVPDVRVVIDTGLHKVARYDRNRGIDSLDLERISQDAAEQRAGRAGRVAAGDAVRLWDPREPLRPHREPDIHRIDLASVVLDVIAWGGHPRTFVWFESPKDDAVASSLDLLRRLGALDAAEALTSIGRALRELPLHPRLGRLLIAAGGAPVAARACALLSERHFVPAPRGATTPATACDLLAAAEDRQLPAHVVRVAKDLQARVGTVIGEGRPAQPVDETAFRRAVFLAYPDRVARRRAPGSDRVLLASGTGARIGRESGVFDAELLVAVDVSSNSTAPAASSDVLIRIATRIERDWLEPTSSSVTHVLDEATGLVRAQRTDWYGAIPMREVPIEVDPRIRADLLAAERRRRGPTDEDQRLLRRLAYARSETTFDALVDSAAAGATRLEEIDLADGLSRSAKQSLDRDAPSEWLSPRGRRVRLDYRADGRIHAAIKLQELFGMLETPRIGPARTPITFELLAPNGRPVQVTSDLKSFWATGYAIVRKELRARYPKHAWPENPNAR